MRIEIVNGRKLVCGHIFNTEEIKEGQLWAAASGANHVVKISKVHYQCEWVEYEWTDSKGMMHIHEKQAFAFQCRYCKVVEHE